MTDHTESSDSLIEGRREKHEAVVAGGRVYDSARLASMLREAGAAGKAQPAPTPGAP